MRRYLFEGFINYIMNVSIQVILIIGNIQKRCCYYDFKINKIKLKRDQNIIILNKNFKHNLDWDIFNRYCPNCELVDIEYYYNKELYNIQFERDYEIEFPLEFENTIIRKKFLCINDDILNDVFIKYAGPNKDFYQSNNISLKLKNICNMNNIDEKQFIFTNSMLEEKTIKPEDTVNV